MIRRPMYCYILLIMVLLIACSKKKSHPINADLKKEFGFKKGTYWIYNNLLTTKMDSFVIIEDTYSVDDYNHDDIEMHRLYGYENGTIQSANSFWTVKNQSVRVLFEFPTSTVNYNDLFYFPLVNGGYAYADYDSAIITIIPAITVTNNVFNNVAEIIHRWRGSRGDTFYVEPNVGIVRMSSNFELLRYHIVR